MGFLCACPLNAMAETSLDTIPGGNVPSDQSENDMHAALDETYLKLYGFSFQETYRHALRFYKENESKSSNVNLNYNDKCRLVAYTQQALHGPLEQAKVAPLGVLDVIGKDRR